MKFIELNNSEDRKFILIIFLLFMLIFLLPSCSVVKRAPTKTMYANDKRIEYTKSNGEPTNILFDNQKPNIFK